MTERPDLEELNLSVAAAGGPRHGARRGEGGCRPN